MVSGIALAFVAGLVTILNPCVLPLVPIIVASALGKSRWGPAALAGGLVASFASLGLLILAFGFSVGIDGSQVRQMAGVLLLLAGIVLLVPRAQMALSGAAAPLTSRVQQRLGQTSGEGVVGQFVVGALLGLIWAPCVGPTLGIAIAAASQGENLLSAFLILLVFGLGVAASILGLAYGSRKALGHRGKALAKIARIAKPILGGAVILVGAMVLTGFDKVMETALLDILPQELIAFTTRF